MKAGTDCCWRLIKALEAAAQASSTMPPAHALAERLGVSVPSVHRALRRLISAALLECLEQGGGTRSGTYRLTSSGAVLHGAPSRRPRGSVRGQAGRSVRPAALEASRNEDEQAVRKCLRCQDTFLSAHKCNRICEPCKSHTDFGPGAEPFRVAMA